MAASTYNSTILFGIVSKCHKQAQTVTSSNWCVSVSGFTVTCFKLQTKEVFPADEAAPLIRPFCPSLDTLFHTLLSQVWFSVPELL